MRVRISIILICFIIICGGIFLFKDNLLIKIYPNKYSDFVEAYSEEYNVEKNLVYAVIKQESNFNEEASSRKGAIGLMQLMTDTADEIAEELEVDNENVYNPEINIKFGTKYLSDLLNKYQNKEMAIVAYNAGFGNVDKWIARWSYK